MEQARLKTAPKVVWVTEEQVSVENTLRNLDCQRQRDQFHQKPNWIDKENNSLDMWAEV
jgi:hypothetical protein